MPSDRAVGRRYSGALAELAEEAGRVREVGADLDRLQGVFEAEDGRLMAVMSNPAFSIAERRQLLEALLRRLQVDPLVERFLLLLLDRHRFRSLSEVLVAWHERADARAGRLRARVTTARPLQPQTLEMVRDALAEAFGRPVVSTSTVDPSLIAGLVVQVGDRVYDASLRARVEHLSRVLMNPHHAEVSET